MTDQALPQHHMLASSPASSVTPKYCTFGHEGSTAPACRTFPSESGMCPRHEFMVAQMGATEALRAEIGLACSCCAERFFDVGELRNCQDCARESVCGDCLEDMACCQRELENADEEQDEAFEELRDVQRRIHRLRERVDKKTILRT